MAGSLIVGNIGSVQIGTSSGWKVLINTVCLWRSFQFISGSDDDVVRLIQRVYH